MQDITILNKPKVSPFITIMILFFFTYAFSSSIDKEKHSITKD